MQPRVGQPPVAHGGDDRGAQARNVTRVDPRTEAECISAGSERPYRALFHPDGVGDRAHLERIGDHHTVVSELVAHEPGEMSRAECRRF